MKKFRPVLFTLLLITMMVGGGVLLQATVVLAGNGVQVSINAPAEVTPGDNFTASVNISEVIDLIAVQYVISFDPSVLRLDGITAGQIDSTVIGVGVNKIGSGTWSVVQVMGLTTVSGSGYLSKLHFYVTGSIGNNSTISLSKGMLASNLAEEIPATWIGASVNVVSTGGGGGELPPTTSPLPEPEITKTVNIIDDKGFFTENATAWSEDSTIKLTIGKGTCGLIKEKGKEDKPLSEISIVPITGLPLVLPVNHLIISLSYNLGPDGASFDPAIELAFTYDPSDVPEGISLEEDLAIAWWDKTVDDWIKLEDSIVDINAHTITASINHFTAFTILAHIPASPIPIFIIFDPVDISPRSVGPGENLTISAVVTNIGRANGSYDVTLKIDGSTENQTAVEIAAGDSMQVSFTISRALAGTYLVDLNDKTGSFTVVEEAAPVSTQTAEVVAAQVVTEKEKVATEEEVASASPQPGKPVNWPVLWGVIGAIVIVAALAIFFRVRRRLY